MALGHFNLHNYNPLTSSATDKKNDVSIYDPLATPQSPYNPWIPMPTSEKARCLETL